MIGNRKEIRSRKLLKWISRYSGYWHLLGILRISVYGLRHMYATALLEKGVSLAKISALLGHSSVNTTFEFYVWMVI